MTAIEEFLAQKNLSTNSHQAYAYDLEQFRQVVSGEIDGGQLLAYQRFIGAFKPSVQRRKISAVNQFLAYLYENGQLKTFHRIKHQSRVRPVEEQVSLPSLKDLSALEGDYEAKQGQVIALLILHLGLQPIEISRLKVSAIDLAFGVATAERLGQVRVLRLPKHLTSYLKPYLEGIYLFGKGEKPYSRQWLFNQLRDFLKESGHPDLNAQKLREQYILRQLEAGVALQTLAQELGLKSPITLTRYATKQR